MNAAERNRRKAVLEKATQEGFRTGAGDEVAILCTACHKPMLIIRTVNESGPVSCVSCGTARRLREAGLILKVGDRVRFGADQFRPIGNWLLPISGLDGTVTVSDKHTLAIKLDVTQEALAEWDNELIYNLPDEANDLPEMKVLR